MVLDSAPGPATLVLNNTTATLERVDETEQNILGRGVLRRQLGSRPQPP